MNTTKVNDNSICLNCLEIIDTASSFHHDSPKPKVGDLSVCAYCLEIGQFNDNFSLQPLSDFEMVDLRKNYPTVYSEINTIKSILFNYKKR
jgi:hypothetical protein